MSQRGVIIKAALFSRLALVTIQYVSNLIIPDHDAGVFTTPELNLKTPADALVHHFLGGFVRWDAHYFMHIARFGYTYENTLAFFPLYPIMTKIIAQPLILLLPALSHNSTLLLVFLALNTLIFVLSALSLHELSVMVVGKTTAFKATLLFCFNPASVFFAAPYTECVFSYLTFKSMLNCFVLFRKYSMGNLQVKIGDLVYLIIPIGLGGLTRSNGVLNIGFLMYTLVCLHVRSHRWVFLGLGVFAAFLCLAPFLAFQFYAFWAFCRDFQSDFPLEVAVQARDEGFVLCGEFSRHNQTWCWGRVPLAYSYIQGHYWGVGFLKYYQLKQIPNFLLATPIVALIVNGTIDFVRQCRVWGRFFNFELKNCRIQPVMIVFVGHAVFLTLFCLLNVHIQVTTRMLCSATPVVYWFGAVYLTGPLKNPSGWTRPQSLVVGYFLSYFVVGTIMFCNFLPWT